MIRKGFRGAWILTGVAVTLAIASCGSPSDPGTSGRQLVFQDEFDGPAGQSPDASRWGYDIGTDWGNGQLEYDTSRPKNVSLDGAGHLAITALKESYSGQAYTSARINTKGLFEQARGRFEARIKLPVGQGMWPAFWLLGSNIDTATWPACGEVDVMENRGQAPAVVHGSLHGPGYSGGGAFAAPYQLSSGTFDGDFHVFAVEWTVESITWYVDGTAYQAIAPADLKGRRWVFDHPFFVILDLAVGGNYVGPPDGTTAFPQTMLVDWVRVYQAAS